MQTDTIEKNVEFSDAIRSIEDIKASYPDEWIVLGDPVEDEFHQTIAGVVLYHSLAKTCLYHVSSRGVVQTWHAASLHLAHHRRQ